MFKRELSPCLLLQGLWCKSSRAKFRVGGARARSFVTSANISLKVILQEGTHP